MAWQTRLSERLMSCVKRACYARQSEVQHVTASNFMHALACTLQSKLLTACDTVKPEAG